MTTRPAIETTHKQRSSSWAWPATVVLIAAMAIAGGLYAYLQTVKSVTQASKDIVEEVKKAFQPRVTQTTVVTGAITDVRFARQLIITRSKVVAEVTKSDQLKVWIVSMGTTVTHVRASDCRVQYVINLEDFGSANVSADEAKKNLTVRFKSPRLDRDIVEIPLDKIECRTDQGWARFNGTELEDQAKRQLRQAAIAQGEQPFLQAEIRENAARAIKQMIQPITDSLGPDWRVDIGWLPN